MLIDEVEDYEVEEEQEEEDTSPIEDMISNALEGDFVNADKDFNAIMADKISDALDQQKVAISNSVFNGIEDDEDFDDEDFDDEDYGTEDLDDDDIDYLNALDGPDDDDD